jgi:hypothetical protein
MKAGQDPIAGLCEMRRVARRVVVFTKDFSDPDLFWLDRDYLPERADLLVGRPSLTELARAIGARLEPVLIPWDCADGFYEAYWRRPEAYLDEHVRHGMSIWARVGPDAEQRAVHSLPDDLASGRWAERNRDLVDLDAAELGDRPVPGHRQPRPHRARPQALEQPIEGCAQRLRHHLRRSPEQGTQVTTENRVTP